MGNERPWILGFVVEMRKIFFNLDDIRTKVESKAWYGDYILDILNINRKLVEEFIKKTLVFDFPFA